MCPKQLHEGSSDVLYVPKCGYSMIDWGNLRGQIFSLTGFAPSEGAHTSCKTMSPDMAKTTHIVARGAHGVACGFLAAELLEPCAGAGEHEVVPARAKGRDNGTGVVASRFLLVWVGSRQAPVRLRTL